MKNFSILNEFTNNVSSQWFKNFFTTKMDELKVGFFDVGTDEDADFTPNLATLNKIFTNLKKDVKIIETFEEVNSFIDKMILKTADGKEDVRGNTLQNELIEAFKTNASDINEKVTEVIVKMQLGSISKSTQKALKVIEVLKNKLGKDTIFEEIEREDIEYILDSELKTSIDKLLHWSTIHPTHAENYKEELDILQNHNNGIKDRNEAATIIAHYFGTIIGNEIDQFDIEELNTGVIDKRSKVVIFNQGISICDEICAKIDLIVDVYSTLDQH